MNIEEPQSPCVRICQMDAANQYCMGCFRTAQEIANWSRSSAAEKLALLEKLEARLNAAFG